MLSLELDVRSVREHSSPEDALSKGRTVDGEKDGEGRERMRSRTGQEDLERSITAHQRMRSRKDGLWTEKRTEKAVRGCTLELDKRISSVRAQLTRGCALERKEKAVRGYALET